MEIPQDGIHVAIEVAHERQWIALAQSAKHFTVALENMQYMVVAMEDHGLSGRRPWSSGHKTMVFLQKVLNLEINLDA